MESGRRTILISVVGVLAAIGLMLGVGFGVARRVGSTVRHFEQPQVNQGVQTGQIMADLAGFDTVSSEGGWIVTITQGETFGVALEASEKALEQVDVFTRGDTLHLELGSGIQSITGNLRATVTMPDLEQIRTAGGASVSISGFDLDNLDVEVDGAASVTARNGSIENLSIDSDGAASFDFDEVAVMNADVEMDGASNLDIDMDGGSLTGVLRGLGNVTFSGDVANESIRIDGLGRVHRE